jgi:hypothetical protein
MADAGFGTLVMGLWAKYPIALAPGMGLNAFFAYSVVLGMGIPWQVALSGTFLSGLIFFVLVVTKMGERILNAIPMQMKLAVGAGIGLFVGFPGLKNAGIVVNSDANLAGLNEVTGGILLLLGPLKTVSCADVVRQGIWMRRGVGGVPAPRAGLGAGAADTFGVGIEVPPKYQDQIYFYLEVTARFVSGITDCPGIAGA